MALTNIEIHIARGASMEESQKNLEKALKVLKNKTFKLGIVKELRERAEYTKPSAKKRLQREKTIHKNKYLNNF
jgi:small subunit ribosomal protein S21